MMPLATRLSPAGKLPAVNCQEALPTPPLVKRELENGLPWAMGETGHEDVIWRGGGVNTGGGAVTLTLKVTGTITEPVMGPVEEIRTVPL
jgi:hypothetical protein